MITRIIITVIILLGTVIAQRLLQSSITRFGTLRQIKRIRSEHVHRLTRIAVWLAAGILLVSVWGVNTQNLWIFVTGVVGALAVAFFAMWSMLSNVVAGVLLFLSDPFRIDDEIVIVSDDVKGVVKDIKTLFVVLEDENGDMIHIPNNLLFQKIVKTTTIQPEQ